MPKWDDVSRAARRLGWVLFFLGLPAGFELPGFVLVLLATPVPMPWRSRPTNQSKAVPTKLARLFILFCAWSVLAAVVSDWPSFSLGATLEWLVLIVLGMHATRTLDWNDLRAYYMPALAAGSIGLGLWTIVRFVTVGGRVGTWAADVNLLGSLTAMSALLLLSYLVWAIEQRRHLVAGFACLGVLGAVCALAASQSRGAWLGFALAGLFLAWRSRRAIVGVVIALAALAAAALFVPVWWQRLESIVQYSANTTRVYLWQSSWAMLKDHWVVGVGGGAFGLVYPDYRVPMGPSYESLAHNLELNIATQIGVPGLLLFLAIAGAWCYEAFWRRRQNGNALFGGLLAAMLSLIIHDQVDITLFSAVVAVPIWVWAGTVLRCELDADRRAIRQPVLDPAASGLPPGA